MSKLKVGLIQLFYGNGRGKTTAAMGTATRAVGHGLKVVVFQFLKGGDFTGEAAALKKLGVEFYQLGPSGTSVEKDKKIEEGTARVEKKHFEYSNEDITREQEGLRIASEKLASGEYDLVVLDEIVTAISFGHLDEKGVAAVLKKKHPQTEVILTGHILPKLIEEICDLITEVKKVKHPFDKGLLTRWGVDY